VGRAPERLIPALRSLVCDAPLRLRVVGDCMTPNLSAGSTVEIAPLRLAWPGDIVAFAAAGRLVVHRVVGYRPRGRRLDLLVQADVSAIPDAPVPLSRVLGRVRARVTLGQRVSALGRFARHVLARLRTRAGRALR